MVDRIMLKANWMQSSFSRTNKMSVPKQDFETFNVGQNNGRQKRPARTERS